MNVPEYLYHGTSETVAQRALKAGLLPRSAHRNGSNWTHSVESNPDTIYLSDAYAPYFAVAASDIPKDGTDEFEEGGVEAAVIQIDVSKLDHFKLVPDEDVLEQSGRRYDNVKGKMKQRTRWYRTRLKQYRGTEAWLASLEAMGTCGHIGPIPVEAISRVAYWDLRNAPRFTFANMDAMICLANYRFVGDKYKNLTNQLFDIPTINELLGARDQLPLAYQLQMKRAAKELKAEIDGAKRIVEINADK